MLQPAIQQLSNYLLNPLGLAALLALIPLIIFYLMRPSPEEKVMPSMKFFQQDRKSGRLRKALRILQRNFMLLLHILMIAALAAAIANPYIMADKRPQNAVIVIDNSASMKPVFNQVKDRAVSELGRSNTVVLANDEAEVPLRKVSYSRAENFIRGLKAEETGSSIGRALERARNYDGKMFVASDFDSTSQNPVETGPLLKSISASRPLQTFSPAKSNSWGIVDLKIFQDNATVFIQNFRQKNVQTRLKVGEDSRNIQLNPGELRKISFTLEKGRNTVKLGDDDFQVDNNAYIFKPGSRSTRVAVIANQKNRYLMKAFELMNGVNASYMKPSDPLPEADVYIVGKISDPGQLDTGKISSRIKEGSGLVLQAQKKVTGLPDEWTIPSIGKTYRTAVKLRKPVELDLDNATVFHADVKGDSAADPTEALKFSDYGEGNFVFMNFASKKFRENLMYPVFWKQLVEKISSKASLSELNRKTGTTILTDKRTVELSQTGFKRIGGDIYASNLLNGDESSLENSKHTYSSLKGVKKPFSLRSVPIAVLIFLGLAEIGYLWRRGEVP